MPLARALPSHDHSCYHIQTGRVEVLVPFTNTLGTVPYREAAEGAYFIERGMDLQAAPLGWSPPGCGYPTSSPANQFPHATLLGNSYDSGEYTRALGAATIGSTPAIATAVMDAMAPQGDARGNPDHRAEGLGGNAEARKR